MTAYNPMYNPYSLQGKTILITGASSGIGQTTAIECSRLGATCVITGRNAERLQQTMDALSGSDHLMVVADLSMSEGIDALVDAMPKIDGLVNNAGRGITRPIAFYKQDDLNDVFQINTFAPMLLTKSIVKKKKLNAGGAIVFTSSGAATGCKLGNGIYGASKAALTAYMRYCAKELAPKGIRANAIHPAMVETPFIHDGSLSEADLKQDMQKYPLGRYGRKEEIAWGIIYLLSDATAWITGTSLIIDGGLSLL